MGFHSMLSADRREDAYADVYAFLSRVSDVR